MTEQQKETLGLVGSAFMVLGLAVGWYFAWVRPHDEFLGQVMSCQQDGSRAEYVRCAEIVRLSSR